MKRLFTLALIGLFSVMLAQAEAVEPGDVGSVECQNVQLEAQEAVLNGMPYRNHGQMVSTAAKVVSEYVCVEEAISYECASCIMNQFARKIPIDDQESCVPLLPVCDNPWDCRDGSGDSQGTCNPDFIGQCYCFATDSQMTSGACVDNYYCSGAEDCSENPCPDGKTCYYNTCCGPATCGPSTCTGVMRSLSEGPSAAGN